MRWNFGEKLEEAKAAQDFECQKLSTDYPQAIKDLASLDRGFWIKEKK